MRTLRVLYLLILAAECVLINFFNSKRSSSLFSHSAFLSLWAQIDLITSSYFRSLVKKQRRRQQDAIFCYCSYRDWHLSKTWKLLFAENSAFCSNQIKSLSLLGHRKSWSDTFCNSRILVLFKFYRWFDDFDDDNEQSAQNKDIS